MSQTSPSTSEELARRHRAAAMVVGAMLGLTVALVAVAFVAGDSLYRPADRSLPMALFIAILIFALGSFVLRRTRFQAARLQDIAALRGISGVLETLQKTTVQVAFIGGAIALMGFVVAIIAHDDGRYHMLRGGAVAAIVLISAYPRRGAWQRLVKAIEQSGVGADPEDDDTAAKGIVA
ncbi:MAG TPA: hypothetical protein VGC87_20385 [Pyrinomonadaceae bacterium]|jgi:hypothetical protein